MSLNFFKAFRVKRQAQRAREAAARKEWEAHQEWQSAFDNYIYAQVLDELGVEQVTEIVARAAKLADARAHYLAERDSIRRLVNG